MTKTLRREVEGRKEDVGYILASPTAIQVFRVRRGGILCLHLKKLILIHLGLFKTDIWLPRSDLGPTKSVFASLSLAQFEPSFQNIILMDFLGQCQLQVKYREMNSFNFNLVLLNNIHMAHMNF